MMLRRLNRICLQDQWAISLSKMDESQLLSDLSELNSEKVRIEAAKNLGVINNQISKEALIDALGTLNSFVRDEIVQSLVRIGDVEFLCNNMNNEHRYVRRGIVQALGELGGEMACKILTESLKDREWGVRMYAAESLGKVGNQVHVPKLIPLLKDEHEWPLARTDWQQWNLHSQGSANSVRGDGELRLDAPTEQPHDEFVYDPQFPVQTVGGANCCSPNIEPWGPYDQRPVEARNDVLVYTSPVMEDDLEVIGPITLRLYAATDGPDTDWTAKLVDVSPSGYAMNLCDGIVRARYRLGQDVDRMLTPGRVEIYDIEVGVTANVFRRGHQIRLEVSSSNFPRFDRNLNTGNDLARDSEIRVAQQQVLHVDRGDPSAHRDRRLLPAQHRGAG